MAKNSRRRHAMFPSGVRLIQTGNEVVAPYPPSSKARKGGSFTSPRGYPEDMSPQTIQ